jgi:hypothetical protein
LSFKEKIKAKIHKIKEWGASEVERLYLYRWTERYIYGIVLFLGIWNDGIMNELSNVLRSNNSGEMASC